MDVADREMGLGYRLFSVGLKYGVPLLVFKTYEESAINRDLLFLANSSGGAGILAGAVLLWAELAVGILASYATHRAVSDYFSDYESFLQKGGVERHGSVDSFVKSLKERGADGFKIGFKEEGVLGFYGYKILVEGYAGEKSVATYTELSPVEKRFATINKMESLLKEEGLKLIGRV